MVKIISDSTCDLSEELVKRYDITILPLHILLGDEEYLDGVNITPQEIFDWSDEHKTTPKTSAPSAEQAVELLKPYVEKGQEVICFAIASGMSSSMNVMRLAAEELNAENLVTVIDSANLSTGIGLLVIEAAEMAQQGISCNVHYIPLPMLTAYRTMGFRIEDFPNAYEMYHNEITLPLHTCLTDEQADYVIDTFCSLVK